MEEFIPRGMGVDEAEWRAAIEQMEMRLAEPFPWMLEMEVATDSLAQQEMAAFLSAQRG